MNEKTISVPKGPKPWSALDGITLMALDTDPEANLALMLANAPARGFQVIGSLPWVFHGRTLGYLVVLYDATKDPRAAPRETPK